MLTLDREYSSVGVHSVGSALYVFDDTLSKFVLLVPTSDMPAGAGAPDTIENPILTVTRNGQVEGKQTIEQKELTYNYNRDNNRRLDKYVGKQVKLLERDGMEFTGNIYLGTISYSKNAYEDNEIMNGTIYVTVNEDLGYVDDIRDLIALTAVIKTPLPALTVQVGEANAVSIKLETTANATVTATSESTSVATATMSNNTLSITGVATGFTIIKLTCSATNEGTSERTVMVSVIA